MTSFVQSLPEKLDLYKNGSLWFEGLRHPRGAVRDRSCDSHGERTPRRTSRLDSGIEYAQKIPPMLVTKSLNLVTKSLNLVTFLRRRPKRGGIGRPPSQWPSIC